VIPLSFVSDVFGVGGERMPGWLDTLGWVFPLKHLVNALADATNPFHTGSGFAAGHLGVLVLWTLGGALVAARRLSAEPRPARPAGRPARTARPGSARTARRGRPSLARLLLGEVRHANAMLWRDPGSTFFAVAFPLLLVLLVPQIYGTDATLDDGTPLPRFYASVMAVYGAAVTAYVNMPEDLARARERGVLQRIGGTPLPLPVLVLGRVLASVWVAVLTIVGVFAVAGVLYDVPVPPTWPGALLTVLLSVTCFALLGVALATVLPSSRATTAVALGTLLPLSFVSDIFVVGADFPWFLDALGWATPLRHATRAMSDAYALGATGTGFAWGHLAVIAAWLLAGLAVVLVRARQGALTRRR
jgi:ABC-2 type transport system permease protein